MWSAAHVIHVCRCHSPENISGQKKKCMHSKWIVAVVLLFHTTTLICAFLNDRFYLDWGKNSTHGRESVSLNLQSMRELNSGSMKTK